MAVDYDLVIIGSSWVGIYAAQQAAQLQARVALVTQSDELFLPNDSLTTQSISEVGRWNYQLRNNPWAKVPQSISLPAAQDWLGRINGTLQGQNSLANLAALGVDVIVDKGEFCRLPNLVFQTARRKLRSRKFLLATGANFVPEVVDPQDSNSYLTPRDLWQMDLENLGEKLIIVGGNPMALELAQTLVRFKKSVTLVTDQPRILPQEDLACVLLLQAQLEAEGIKVYADSPVSQIKTLDGQQWLQAGDRALTADQIIITNGQQPHITGLNLAGVGVKYDQTRVQVNSQLQTTNPDIYGCGDVIGGYSLPTIARYEANLVLKNTLFFPWYRANYHSLPWAILTQPNFARVGLTTQQAKQQYGADLYIIQEHFADLERSQITDCTTGMARLLIKGDGEIVGCSLIADGAGELITLIALMMQQGIKLDRNPMKGLTTLSLPTTYLSQSDIWQRAFNNFYRQKLQRQPRMLYRLRSWFSFRKAR